MYKIYFQVIGVTTCGARAGGVWEAFVVVAFETGSCVDSLSSRGAVL